MLFKEVSLSFLLIFITERVLIYVVDRSLWYSSVSSSSVFKLFVWFMVQSNRAGAWYYPDISYESMIKARGSVKTNIS